MRVMVTMVNMGGGHATSSEFVITPSLTCFEVRQETAHCAQETVVKILIRQQGPDSVVETVFCYKKGCYR